MQSYKVQHKKLKLLSLLLIVIMISGCTIQNPLAKPEATRVSYIYDGDTQMWEHIFDTTEQFAFKDNTIGAILPHHMATSNALAKFYKGLSATVNPDIFFILSPNHYDAGLFDIQTCETCIFNTIDGNLNMDTTIIKAMNDNGIAYNSDEIFLKEHGIYTHATFIKHNFPNAKIVPIVIKDSTDMPQIEKLSEWIENNMPENSFVIASVDFSHYLPREVASFHDITSENTILNMNFDGLLNLEVDSPLSLYTFLYIMKLHGYKNGELIAHTNNNDFIKEQLEETTSHMFFAFSKNNDVNDTADADDSSSEGITMLITGDQNGLDGDHYPEIVKEWQYNIIGADSTQNNELAYLDQLKDLQGKQNRFFRGVDFLLFDPHPENQPDSLCIQEEKNNFKVSICRFKEDSEKYDEYEDILKEQSEKSDFVYVIFDFNSILKDGEDINNEIDKNRKKIIEKFAKNGMDMLVGQGIEGVQPMLKLKNAVVFPSLGDFVKDNSLALDLTASSEGIVIGVYITLEEIAIYPFPVKIENGLPKLKDADEKKADFFDFSSKASLHRKNDLIDFHNKVIKIKR